MKFFTIFICSLTILNHVHSAFVDPQYKLVKWLGWGTTLGWIDHLFEPENEVLKEEIYDAIFSPERLNLNVISYTIWGNSPIDSTCKCTHIKCKAESFRDSMNSPYIWSRDSIGRKVLQRAKSLGVDTFEGIVRSPPSWMTRSNCSFGNPEGAPLHDNFDPIMSNTFADYLTEVIKHYHQAYNITFSSVSPFYRPSRGEFQGVGEEGCNMERKTMAHVTKSLFDALKVKNLTFCNISTADEGGVNDAILTQKYLADDKDIAALYKKVNVQRRFFSDNEKIAELTTLADKYGHNIWSSETAMPHTKLPDISSGLNLALRIISDIRTLVPSVYLYWQVIEPHTWGLLQVEEENPTMETTQFSSGFYTMMQFSKYIRKGFTIVHVSDNNSVAAYDEASNVLVIVTVNPSASTINKSFDLSAFSSLGEVAAFRTSPYEPHVIISPPIVSNKQINFELSTNSVNTLRIENAVAYTRTNLVQNGDFEEIYNNETSNPWSLAFGTRPDNGVNDKYSFRGKYSGNLDLNESMLTLMQTVIVNVTRTYHLSAWCSTTGVGNTLFGILVNGMQGPEITIEHDKGYQLYGLSVNATELDVLGVYLRSERGNHTAQIDNVMLH